MKVKRVLLSAVLVCTVTACRAKYFLEPPLEAYHNFFAELVMRGISRRRKLSYQKRQLT